MEHSEEKALTSLESQKLLGCGNTKFWVLVKQGELKGYRIGNEVRIYISSIADYRERHAI